MSVTQRNILIIDSYEFTTVSDNQTRAVLGLVFLQDSCSLALLTKCIIQKLNTQLVYIIDFRINLS